MDIKPIETRYAGCRFRSRLEARWAVFFDHLGVRWEYEPEGYRLNSGPYLPDFLLRGLTGDASNDGRTWFEVKHEEVGEDVRWRELAAVTHGVVVVAFGMPDPRDDLIIHPSRGNGWMEMYAWDGEFYMTGENEYSVGWDNFRGFNQCAKCKQVGIAFEGRIERICLSRHHGGSLAPITAAYAAARSARFEHGASGR
jgi:hypothetical protein